MKVLKRTVFASILAVIAMILAGYFMVQSIKMKREVDRQYEMIDDLQHQLTWQDSILVIDQMFLQGRNAEALTSYNQLADQNPWLKEALNGRIKMLNRVMSLERQASSLSDSLQDDLLPEDTIQMAEVTGPEEIRGYDSLLYALEKAKVELSYLRTQLQEKSFGTYLTFSSKKGTTMHYVGEVRNDMANGRGIALLSTGSRYVGEWKDNMRHGQGSFYWPDGEHYEGTYRNDRRTGKGTYIWPSGEKFVGEWQDDERNGEGVFYGPEGDVVARGTWVDDELIEVEEK